MPIGLAYPHIIVGIFKRASGAVIHPLNGEIRLVRGQVKLVEYIPAVDHLHVRERSSAMYGDVEFPLGPGLQPELTPERVAVERGIRNDARATGGVATATVKCVENRSGVELF